MSKPKETKIVDIDVNQTITDGYDIYEVVLKDECNYVIKCVDDRQNNGDYNGLLHIIPHCYVVQEIENESSFTQWKLFESTDCRVNRLLLLHQQFKLKCDGGKYGLVKLANTREMVDLVNPEPHPKFKVDFSTQYNNQGAL